mgnify:CR=1 FL=1|tara:strand:+ start:196 stop:666 length:471 start_codon:yes stop_codon:yes gene_type:complete
MKIFIKFLIVLYVALPATVLALEVGKWSFEKTDEYCYIGSLATDTDLPSDKKRGDFYVLVYKNIGNPDTVVQIEAGYNYKVSSDIIVIIDKGDYKFYTTEDLPTAAWTEEDNKVIFAMKKGLELTVTGESSRGTITNDIYTLNGFTAAYNKLINNC